MWPSLAAPSGDWAEGFAGATVDTLVGMNVKRPLAFRDVVDQAFFIAGRVLDVHTWLGDYIGHGCSPQVCSMGALFC